MKRVKLINDPADLVSLFHSVDSDARREILSLLSQGWTPISDLTDKFGDEANAAISFFEKFKLVESRWEVKDSKPQKAYRTFYNAFQISSSLSFDEAQELLTIEKTSTGIAVSRRPGVAFVPMIGTNAFEN